MGCINAPWVAGSELKHVEQVVALQSFLGSYLKKRLHNNKRNWVMMVVKKVFTQQTSINLNESKEKVAILAQP